MIDDEERSPTPTEDPPGPSAARSIEDRLLLAIIDAYPAPKLGSEERAHGREDRLRKARRALFGETSDPGERLDYDDKALHFMAKERYDDRSRLSLRRLNPESPLAATSDKIRSVSALARLAAQKFFPGLTESTEAGRLRKAFRTRGAYYLDVLRFTDDLPERADYPLLLKITALLEEAGIRTELSDDPFAA